jgi:hypothetical protein
MFHTVNTAKATVPTMKPFEDLYFSKYGAVDPCCVRDESHRGRDGMIDAGISTIQGRSPRYGRPWATFERYIT